MPLSKRRFFRSLLGVGIIGFLALSLWPFSARAQGQIDPTATPTVAQSDRYITVTYIEPINVRNGPGSYDYSIIGSLPVGGTALAIGRSPAGEWIQIEYPGVPGGTGWVYAANVTLSPGPYLPIVEPPPTATPLESPTVNPTFAAAFQVTDTPTRLPTFTSAPTLSIPTYQNPSGSFFGQLELGWVIFGLVFVGLLGIIITSFWRR